MGWRASKERRGRNMLAVQGRDDGGINSALEEEEEEPYLQKFCTAFAAHLPPVSRSFGLRSSYEIRAGISGTWPPGPETSSVDWISHVTRELQRSSGA
jgi:hypothetical protein